MPFLSPFPGGSTVLRTFQFHGTPAATSFASVPIGAASANRVVVVTTNNSSATTLTIGGISAVAQVTQAALKIWSVVVPTGTTATITCNASVNIAVYTLTGSPSATASHTANAASNSTTISENAGSVVIAMGSGNAAGGPATWTNLTADAADSVVGFNDSSASANLSTTNAALSISFSTSGTVFNIAAASWNP